MNADVFERDDLTITWHARFRTDGRDTWTDQCSRLRAALLAHGWSDAFVITALAYEHDHTRTPTGDEPSRHAEFVQRLGQAWQQSLDLTERTAGPTIAIARIERELVDGEVADGIRRLESYILSVWHFHEHVRKHGIPRVLPPDEIDPDSDEAKRARRGELPEEDSWDDE